MTSVSEITGGGLSAVETLKTQTRSTEVPAHQSDVFVDRLYPPIRSSRYEQFRMYELFHGEDDPVLYAKSYRGPRALMSHRSRYDQRTRYPELSTALFAYSTLNTRFR